jgi:hypothetical protein
MRKKIGYIILGFLSLLQVICGLGIFYLEDLSRKRVGVNHHVIIRKKEFISSWMSNNQIDVYKLVLLVIVVLAVMYFIYQVFRRENCWRYVSTFLVILLSVLVYFELILEVFQNLPVYMYLVYITVGILFIEIIKVVIQKLIDIEIIKKL